jgi:SSS family solute:Na+ symporter
VAGGWQQLRATTPDHFNSIAGEGKSVPFGTLFTGVMLLNLFYWCTNQQIIQRTFGASSLAEGQKGVLLTGALKLLGPLYLVVPGLIAYHLFASQNIRPDHAYGMLVREVLPAPLAGFFAAVMVGAILSSFNSALNSTTTLFSLGLYRGVLRRNATDAQTVASGKVFGWIMAFVSMSLAPLLAGQDSIFKYLQKMNGIYFIPIFAVVVVGMLARRVPPLAAKVALVAGFTVIATGYFVPPFDGWIAAMHEFHFLGAVFALLVITMLVIGRLRPLPAPWVQVDVKAVDLTPWRRARLTGAILLVIVFAIYAFFADFSVLAAS